MQHDTWNIDGSLQVKAFNAPPPSTFSYVASPYSGTPSEQSSRHAAVEHYTAWLLRHEHHCFSPIVHCHHLTINHSLPGDAIFWQEYNFAMLRVASTLHVLNLLGAAESKGLAGEIAYAASINKPIYLINPIDKGGYSCGGETTPRELASKLCRVHTS